LIRLARQPLSAVAIDAPELVCVARRQCDREPEEQCAGGEAKQRDDQRRRRRGDRGGHGERLAALAACDAVRAESPHARLLYAEPAIHIDGGLGGFGGRC